MSDAASLAVLRDVFACCTVALALGLFVYSLVRVRTGLGWNHEGNVLSRPYDTPDGIVAFVLLGFFVWSGWQGKAGMPDPTTMDPTEYALGLFFGASVLVFVVLLLLMYLQIYRSLNPAEMFGLRQLTVWSALGNALLWLIGVAFCMGTLTYLISVYAFDGKWFDESQQDVVETFNKSSSIGVKALLACAAIIIAPLTEEIVFRGFLYGVIKRFSDRWFAAIFTALIFAAVHQHVGSLFPLFLLGFGLALAYEVTGCLLVPVFMHAIFNATSVTRILLQ
jgi:uncharacterized protein